MREIPKHRSIVVGTLWAGLLATPLYGQSPPQATNSGPPQAPPDVTQPTADGPSDETSTDPQRTLDLSGPRATMRTFLVAMQDAIGDHPERIDDAVKCLDVSELEGEDKEERARLLAQRLHAIIDAKGVKLDDLPASSKHPDEFVFLRLEKDEGVEWPEDTPRPAVIAFERSFETGHWLFSAETLASIPALESSAKVSDKPEIAKDTTVPVARRSARATINTFLQAMNADPPELDTAVLCLDPTGQDPQVWGVRGRELAITLKSVMDKIKVAILAEIPDAPDGPPYVWYASELGNIVVGRIEADSSDAKDSRFDLKKGEWRFTAQTLKTLDALHREFEDTEIVAELRDAGVKEQQTFRQRVEREMPDWLRGEAWIMLGWQWLALAALLLLGWLIQAAVAMIFGHLLRRWLRSSKLDLERESQRHVARSVGVLATVIFWHLAIQPLGLPASVLGVLLRGTKFAMGVAGVWAAYRLVDVVGGQIAANRDVRLTRFDDVLIPLLQKILRILVVLVGILIVADLMDWKITAVLGALGVGGVALAFAAQDTIGNFFGSITVLFDRPFGIGDWIVIGDVEGTVERVGFRSTRVRTFYNSVVTIPNSKMVNTQVDNYGARRYRRTKVLLSLTYDTPPEKIDAFCEGIRELIRLHPYTRKDYYHVYFNQFAGSSLDVLLYTFFEVPDWGTELRERHRLFSDILRLARQLDVQFAFPTRTVWLERSGGRETPRRTEALAGADPDVIGQDEAAKLFEQVYGSVSVARDPVVIERMPRSRYVQAAQKNKPSGGGESS